METTDNTTILLQAMQDGDDSAAAALFPLVYDQLRVLAGRCFSGQPRDHTLQPTALVNEAFVKLVRGAQSQWRSRAHFLAVAAGAMRQILIDHARAKQRHKRGGGAAQFTLAEDDAPVESSADELLDLDDALGRLSRLDARQSRIIELRYFGGMTVYEVAHVLGLSKTTVESEWRMARAWLRRELAGNN